MEKCAVFLFLCRQSESFSNCFMLLSCSPKASTLRLCCHLLGNAQHPANILSDY